VSVLDPRSSDLPDLVDLDRSARSPSPLLSPGTTLSMSQPAFPVPPLAPSPSSYPVAPVVLSLGPTFVRIPLSICPPSTCKSIPLLWRSRLGSSDPHRFRHPRRGDAVVPVVSLSGLALWFSPLIVQLNSNPARR
jgi:hypothetical protein